MAVHPGPAPGVELNRGDTLTGMGDGLTRTAFAYFVGVILFRLHQNRDWLRSTKAPPVALAAILFVLFSVAATTFPALLQIAVIALAFPAIILLGANHVPAGRMSGYYAIAGRLSYPFYVLHISVMITMMGFLKWRHIFEVSFAV
jgi:peptidoglycan/LPS O-acetylase OafA/YrhL